MGGKWKEDTQTHYKEILTIFLYILFNDIFYQNYLKFVFV